MVSLRHVGHAQHRDAAVLGPQHRRALVLHLGQTGLGHLSTPRRVRGDAGARLHQDARLPSRRRRRPLGAAGAARRGQPAAVTISPPRRHSIVPEATPPFGHKALIPGSGNIRQCLTLRDTGAGSGDHGERQWTRRSPDCWERWPRSGHSVPPEPRLHRRTSCRRIHTPTCWSRLRTPAPCCKPSMNRPRQKPAKMFRSLNFIITTTIITITTASIVAITTRRSWWCRDIGGIIATIITTTTITASIAATTEVATQGNGMSRTFGSCLLSRARN